MEQNTLLVPVGIIPSVADGMAVIVEINKDRDYRIINTIEIKYYCDKSVTIPLKEHSQTVSKNEYRFPRTVAGLSPKISGW